MAEVSSKFNPSIKNKFKLKDYSSIWVLSNSSLNNRKSQALFGLFFVGLRKKAHLITNSSHFIPIRCLLIYNLHWINSLIFPITDPPEIEIEQNWYHREGEQIEVELNCVVHARPEATVSCCFLLHGIEKLEPNLVFFLLFKGGKISRMKLGLKKDVYLRNLLVSLKNSHFSLSIWKNTTTQNVPGLFYG